MDWSLDDIFLKVRTTLPLVRHEPDEAIVTSKGRIVLDPEDGERTNVGRFEFHVVRPAIVTASGESLLEACDAHSQELANLHGALFDVDDLFVDAVTRQFGGARLAGADMLFVEFIEVFPEFRGRDVGLRAMASIIDAFGAGCGLAVCRPFPMQLSAARKRDPEALARMGATGFATAPEAYRKLRAHWARLGFERIGKTRYLGLVPGAECRWHEEGFFGD